VRTCAACGLERPVSDFDVDRSRKDGRNIYCRACIRVRDAATYAAERAKNPARPKLTLAELRANLRAQKRAWDQRHRDPRVAHVRRRRQSGSLFVLAYKETHPCERCGEDHPACLQFHHRDPSAKDWDVSVLAAGGWSVRRLEEEIAKCEVLCANCHAKEHWPERLARAYGGGSVLSSEDACPPTDHRLRSESGYPRRGSNSQPSDPKSDALSS
jgi:hypothetical protein